MHGKEERLINLLPSLEREPCSRRDPNQAEVVSIRWVATWEVAVFSLIVDRCRTTTSFRALEVPMLVYALLGSDSSPNLQMSTVHPARVVEAVAKMVMMVESFMVVRETVTNEVCSRGQAEQWCEILVLEVDWNDNRPVALGKYILFVGRGRVGGSRYSYVHVKWETTKEMVNQRLGAKTEGPWSWYSPRE